MAPVKKRYCPNLWPGCPKARWSRIRVSSSLTLPPILMSLRHKVSCCIRSMPTASGHSNAGGDRRLVHIKPDAPFGDALQSLSSGTPSVASRSLLFVESLVFVLHEGNSLGCPLKAPPASHFFSTGFSDTSPYKLASARRRFHFHGFGVACQGHDHFFPERHMDTPARLYSNSA